MIVFGRRRRKLYTGILQAPFADISSSSGRPGPAWVCRHQQQSSSCRRWGWWMGSRPIGCCTVGGATVLFRYPGRPGRGASCAPRQLLFLSLSLSLPRPYCPGDSPGRFLPLSIAVSIVFSQETPGAGPSFQFYPLVCDLSVAVQCRTATKL